MANTTTNTTTTNVGNSQESSSAVTQATVGWLELLKTARNMQKKHKNDMEELRRQMTRNYRLVTTEIEKEHGENNDDNENDEERAKKWIRENLEEAQLFIDRIVGIKGITEDPLKVAAEIEGCSSNVIAANTEGTLEAQFLDHDDTPQSSHPIPLPRVSISSSIVPSLSLTNEELYGY
jgi:hypothetical protein